MLSHLKRLDWLLMGAIALVFSMGLLMFYGSTSLTTGTADKDLFYRQAIFGLIGLIAIIAVSFFDWRILKANSTLVFFIYSAGLAVLFILFAVGSKVRGVTSWFKFGGINVEPVEIVKIILIVVLAKYFSSRHVELYRWKNIFISGLYALIPVGLVMIQPDLGSAVVLAALWFGMILIAGIKARQILFLLIMMSVASVALWNYGLADYQRDRITSFIYPERDPLGGSYQSQQAIIAIGSGGFFGKGLGGGTQTRLGFLPEYQTDFIFGAIAEEWGLAGVLVLLFGYGLIFFRLYRNLSLAPDNFSRLILTGVIIVLGVHFLLNIGANIGFLPITGLPLVFVSYGGSSLISLCVGIGLAQAVRAA